MQVNSLQHSDTYICNSGILWRAIYLFILICSDGDKLRLWENISAEGAVRKLHDVVGSHNMKPGLVLVHGIQNCLQNSQ